MRVKQEVCHNISSVCMSARPRVLYVFVYLYGFCPFNFHIRIVISHRTMFSLSMSSCFMDELSNHKCFCFSFLSYRIFLVVNFLNYMKCWSSFCILIIELLRNFCVQTKRVNDLPNQWKGKEIPIWYGP